MRIRRVAPLSMVKILAFICAVIGAILALLALAGAVIGPTAAEAPGVNVLFGAGAIVVAPILYGVLGAIGALIASVAYNVAADLMGGLELA